MTDDHSINHAQGAGHPGGHGPNGDIHLPPNSWVPVNVALALMTSFVGIITPQSMRWEIVGVGVVWLVGSLVAWARAARSEYLDLP